MLPFACTTDLRVAARFNGLFKRLFSKDDFLAVKALLYKNHYCPMILLSLGNQLVSFNGRDVKCR